MTLLMSQNGNSQCSQASSGDSSPLLEEEVDDCVPAIFMVEEDEQGPVHEPGALLQLCQDRSKGIGVDDILELHEVVQSCLPVLQKNLSCKLAP